MIQQLIIINPEAHDQTVTDCIQGLIPSIVDYQAWNYPVGVGSYVELTDYQSLAMGNYSALSG
jgi:hypothetical protein